jgi:hypothetical protein
MSVTDFELSRRFWERVIATIEVTMFIGFGILIYIICGILIDFGINVSDVVCVILQILFALVIIHANKCFMAELNRRLPIPKRDYYTE